MVFVWTFRLHCFFNNVKVRLNKGQRSRASETLPEQTSKRKSFATIVIVIAKLSIVDICRSIGFIIGCYLRIYLLKVSDRNTRTRGKLCSKSLIKTSVDLVSLLLTLNIYGLHYNCFPRSLGNVFGTVIFQSTYEQLLSKNHLL